MKKIVGLILVIIIIIGGGSYFILNNSFEKKIYDNNASDNNKDNDIKNNSIYNYKTEEIYIDNNGKKIYGVLYKPETTEKVPIIIYSHGLGGNYSYGIDYAKRLVTEGYAFYAFDFCGGSNGSRSDGSTTEMSVLTEMSDLEAVIDEVKTWDFIEKEDITLFGTSQGGLVSSQVAAKYESDINGLIVFYPAYVILDDIHEKYPTKEDIPDRTNYMGWINVSSKYMLDIYDLDFYKQISDYKKDVLIVHGSSDSIVPLKYSKKLNDTYKNSELKVIKGAGHGFYGSSFDEAINYIFEYLDKLN